jgi:hypothetical protein
MILDTGYICPEFSYLGFVPFAPETNVHALINSSGWNGPTQQISGLTGVSGVLGPGTFYPGSGSIDQITRSFWCVKSWQLNVNISRVMAADKMTCQLLIIDPTLPFPPFLDAFGFCSIGAFAGDSNTLPPRNELDNQDTSDTRLLQLYIGWAELQQRQKRQLPVLSL